MSTNPLSQVGHADYQSTNYSGFPSAHDEPVGDPVADYDNDPEARQSSLDRYHLAMGNLRRFVRAKETAEGTVSK